MDSSGEAIVLENVQRSYGSIWALRGVSLVVVEGEIFALIGPNGAGKTTTLRIVVGLLKPDAGRVSVYGYEPWRGGPEFKRIISYLPEDAGVYKHMSGRDFLEFIASLYASSKREAEEMVDYAVRISGLSSRLGDPLKTYSKGMKRRILLAATLMTRPRLAVLDEPTSGLDVYHSIQMRNAVKEYARSTGATVLVSSHNMLEVEYLSDRVAFISGGRIIAIGTPSELKKRYNAVNLEEAFVSAVELEGGGGAAVE